MEGGLPMLNCLLQHTLKSLCSFSDSFHSSKWVYAVFWKILPRNYPPPKLEYGEGVLDRSKRNKRNWILVWEDGYCDFYECERAGRFGTDVFFKMAHEVYNYGEGLVGKVAAENSHKWVFRDDKNEGDHGFVSSWNASIDPQPRAWDFQFNSGIQTIAIISVREGLVQLGSFDKVIEDLNLVINIQRNFSHLYSIPGIFAIQRPHPLIHHSLNAQLIKTRESPDFLTDDKHQLTGAKRLNNDTLEVETPPLKSINFGWNNPQNGLIGPPIWPIPPLFPTMPYSLGALLSKLPPVTTPSCNNIEAHPVNKINADVGVLKEVQFADIKVEPPLHNADQEEKPKVANLSLEVEESVRIELGCEPPRKEDKCSLNLN